jgi:DNA-directed RNA polymerase subunit M/transcription elongation factor TFIIS
MALPVSKTPVYHLTVPSTGENVKFRPFLVKDEKALLLAQQSEDPVVMINTLKEVIRGCLDDNVNINKLATFDIEYIFAQLRARSVGEIIDLVFTCANCEEEGNTVKLKIDLTTIKVNKPEDHTDTISLFDNVGVKMKYPDVDMIKKLEAIDEVDMNSIFEVIISCIDYIYDDEQMFYAKETPKAEMMQFVENLTSTQFVKLQAFFETMPKIKHEVDFECPACKHKNHSVLEGINSFF